MILRQIIVGLSVALALSGCATSGSSTVYLYNGSSRVASWVADIIIWKDAQSVKQQVDWARDGKNVRCIANPGVRATLISQTGNAVKVRPLGSCTGFVHSYFVHSAKYGK